MKPICQVEVYCTRRTEPEIVLLSFFMKDGVLVYSGYWPEGFNFPMRKIEPIRPVYESDGEWMDEELVNVLKGGHSNDWYVTEDQELSKIQQLLTAAEV